MFGFLAPAVAIPRWRQSYARICQTQRRLFGLTSLPFLSYEATFLYQLMIDSGVVPSLPSESPGCCRLLRISSPETQPDYKAALLAAAFGMLLVGIKLRDDIEDHGRWHNHLLHWKYRRQVQLAHKILDAARPGVMQQVGQILDAHRSLESSGRVLQLREFSEPTSHGFALLFRTISDALHGPSDEFEQIGRHVGTAIVTWDCAVDFHRDRIRGEFNPLCDESQVEEALQRCRLELASIGWQLCRDTSVCRTVIESVADRVRKRIEHSDCHVDQTSRLERWGLIRAKGYQYARCDGCEVVCGLADCSACGECACAGGEVIGHGVACCPGGAEPPCFLDGIYCQPCCGRDSPVASKIAPQTTTPSAYERFHGLHGHAAGDLNPQGLVVIDNDKVPARSAGNQYIASGTAVRVMRTDPLGVTVEVTNLPSREAQDRIS